MLALWSRRPQAAKKLLERGTKLSWGKQQCILFTKLTPFSLLYRLLLVCYCKWQGKACVLATCAVESPGNQVTRHGFCHMLCMCNTYLSPAISHIWPHFQWALCTGMHMCTGKNNWILVSSQDHTLYKGNSLVNFGKVLSSPTWRWQELTLSWEVFYKLDIGPGKCLQSDCRATNY